MSELQALREALYPELSQTGQAGASRRRKRAGRIRARALSPRRIVMLLAAIPVLACTTAAGVYIRTSPFEPELALWNLAALAGCDAARAVGLAPARLGEPGYHARNDTDLDGIACETASEAVSPAAPQDPSGREQPGGARFVRP